MGGDGNNNSPVRNGRSMSGNNNVIPNIVISTDSASQIGRNNRSNVIPNIVISTAPPDSGSSGNNDGGHSGSHNVIPNIVISSVSDSGSGGNNNGARNSARNLGGGEDVVTLNDLENRTTSE
eukprot:TRINITY_DN14996_c0_g1_i1.p2 TRINITY_DN14996_c0_g1~~TRINITY_DN14996_c0_g1_i1.p2  ORF type:complete len:130 (-),score=23.95 TRINITY_DN14996_c0_g1_i1:67-432(-)